MSPGLDYNGTATAVVGGLHDASSPDAAKAWLREVFTKGGIDGFLEMYHKGKEKFDGMLFVKFPSVQKREQAIHSFNLMQAKFADATNFMNPDLPLQARVPRSFLNNLKKLLTSAEWGFPKSSVRWNEDRMTLEVAGKPVLHKLSILCSRYSSWIRPGPSGTIS